MLKNRTKFFLGLASITIMLSSCSIMNSEFSKQRYTKFKVHHDENKVAVNNGHDLKQDNSTVVESNDPTYVETNGSSKVVSIPTEQKINKETSSTPVRTYHAINKKQEKMSSTIQLTNVKKQYGDLKKIAKIMNKPNTNEVLLVILCLILPFLAVFLERGIGMEFWIDVLLCFLFYLPGIIYAFYVCFAGGGSSGRGETRR